MNEWMIEWMKALETYIKHYKAMHEWVEDRTHAWTKEYNSHE